MLVRALFWLMGFAWLALLSSVLWPFASVPAGRCLGAVVLLALVLPALPWREGDQQARSIRPPAPGVPFVFGLVLVLASLAALELRQPYYFVQDDNFAQFAPVMLHGCRSFFEGTFPTWNAWQGMGQPTTSTGVYALTYPLTYLSWLVAKGLLRDEYATLDVFCVLHIVLGYAITFRLLHRQLGVRSSLAVVGAWAFSLSGFFLVVARSWYYMVPLALWLPLIAERAAVQLRAPTLLRGLAVGVALGLFFHAGNAQMWTYAVLLYGLLGGCVLAIHLATRGDWLRTGVSLAGAMSACVVIAAPLLIPQARFAEDIPRSAWGSGIVAGLGSLVLPAPIVRSPHPNGWDDWGRGLNMGELHFIGTVTTLGALWALGRIVRLIFRAGRGQHLSGERGALTLSCLGFLVALAFALGEASWPWPALADKPVFEKFSNPFKFLPFVALFAACAGTLIAEQGLRNIRSPSLRLVVTGACFALSAVSAALHIRASDTSFFTYGEKPWPAVDWVTALDPSANRVASLYPIRSKDPGYVNALGHNFASIYERPSFESYDPLVENKPESAHDHTPSRFRDYGITRIAQFDDSNSRELEAIHPKQLSKVGRVTLYELSDAKPLAWQGEEPRSPLSIHWRGNGFELEGLSASNASSGLVHVNVLERRGFVVTDDAGQRLETGRDPLGRLIVQLAENSRSVRVVYQPSWRFGYLLVLVTGILVALLAANRRI